MGLNTRYSYRISNILIYQGKVYIISIIYIFRGDKVPKILVRDIMNSDILLMDRSETISDAVKVMHKKNSDYVLIGKDKYPEGIVTERDVISRALSSGVKLDSVVLSKIMTTPVITIDLNADVKVAWETISDSKTKRLIVTEDDKAIGIVTSFDILAIVPEIFECENEKEGPEGGFCEFCGSYFPTLNEVGGKFVCDSCKDQILEE